VINEQPGKVKQCCKPADHGNDMKRFDPEHSMIPNSFDGVVRKVNGNEGFVR
jgi:hypothetical protein